MSTEITKTSYQIPIGPIHPALKEPVKFNFEIEGEKIINVDVELGHVHRSVEWASRRRNPIQILYLAERICGICSYCHPMAFTLATERAARIDVPMRAQYIRVIHQELERICSHVLWAGVAAHEIGFDTVLFLTWQIREATLDLTEYLCGNRVTKGISMIGGVRRDITPDMHNYINEKISVVKNNFEKLGKIFLEDKTFKLRSQGVGILTKENALKLCAVGPTTRASGVKKDVRIDQPYFAFGDFDIDYITPDVLNGEVNGDVYDRIIVRLLEIKQSIEIIEQAIKNIPEGEIVAEPNLVKLLNQLKKVEGEGIGRMEAPRGEVFHYVKYTGLESPYSWKVRAPTYSNILPWIPMLIGEQIADIPIVAASTDPCMSCTNRVGVVKNGHQSYLNKEELHQLSVEKTRRMMK
jgi:membrane-bound hydrogenase subunit alpha